MTNRLDGKVAVITGASNSIGAATARRFVAEGCRVVLGDIQAEQEKELADTLGSAGVSSGSTLGNSSRYEKYSPMQKEAGKSGL